MWTVIFESTKIENEISKLIKTGKLTSEDRLIIVTWIRQITEEGPESIQNEQRWDDHALLAERKGYRSSCFSKAGRIIYRIENEIIKILIVRITTDHNYKRLK